MAVRKMALDQFVMSMKSRMYTSIYLKQILSSCCKSTTVHGSDSFVQLLRFWSTALPVQRTKKSGQLSKVLHFSELLCQMDAALHLWDERKWDLNVNHQNEKQASLVKYYSPREWGFGCLWIRLVDVLSDFR